MKPFSSSSSTTATPEPSVTKRLAGFLKRNTLVSPRGVQSSSSTGGGSIALDSDAGRDYLQKRIALFAKVCMCISGFFFLAGNTHRILFVKKIGALTGFLQPANLVHLAVSMLPVLVWLIARQPRRHKSLTLAALDFGLVFGTLAGHAFQMPFLAFVHAARLDLLMVLVSLSLLFTRAVIIPSAPRTTVFVSTVSVLPAIGVAMWAGSLVSRAAMFEVTSFTSIWCAATIGLTTLTSRVIYGLREKVAVAKQLGQYVLERKIGEGGMGEVYLARHTMLRRPTAVKLLPPERAGVETVARFEREVRETSRLTHPNTVMIYDYGRTRGGVFYYAMEYLDGLDLQRIVERSGPMPPSRVVHVLAQIAGALSEAHGRGLVHRDVKPANVVLCDRGGVKDTVKVLDFGLVKQVLARDPKHTDVNALIGTPSYLSPEGIRSAELIDARSDLYAVGAIGYFLLTGKHMFKASSVMEMCAAHLHEIPERPSARVRRPLPSSLEAIIMRCLEKDPSARPANAIELRNALLACDVEPWSHDDAACWWEDHLEQHPPIAVEAEAAPMDPNADTIDALDVVPRTSRLALVRNPARARV